MKLSSHMNQNCSICLVQPQYSFNKYLFDFMLYKLYEHLGLEYLQSSLEKAGYVVKNLEGLSMEMTDESILDQAIEFKPKLVGITVDNYSLQASMSLANKIKQRLTDTHITIGGHLPTCSAEEILNDFKFIDSVVLGYGEGTFVEIAERISKSLPLDNVNGVFFRNGSQVIQNPPRKQSLNIDDIPFPARSILRYRQSKGYPASARMITSRGCPFYCAYCTTPAFLSSQICDKWMTRSPKNILEEISDLVNTFGTRVIVFCDDNFIGPSKYGKKRAKEIAKLIIKSELNIHFWVMCRVDSFQDEDDNFVKLLKDAGLWGVFLGVESGVESQLKAYGKSISISQNESIVSLFKKHNIIVELGFIMFHPYVTFNELRKNAEFLYRVGESSIFKYFTNRLELYPKIGFIEDLKHRNLLLNDYQYDYTYGYKFQNSRMENLVISLKDTATNIQPLDEIIWNYKRLSQLISIFIDEIQNNNSNLKLVNELFPIKNGIDTIISNISVINYKSFIKYLKTTFNKELKYKYNDRHKYLLSKEIKNSINYINTLKHLENKLSGMKDSDILGWFFDSSAYNKLCDL